MFEIWRRQLGSKGRPREEAGSCIDKISERCERVTRKERRLNNEVQKEVKVKWDKGEH